jgi:1-phosphofructokinase family hexose kinase
MIYTVTLNPTIDRTIHFPQVVVGALNRATRSVTDLSGKGVNVSVALSRFGLESVLAGFVAGVYGRVLVEGLRAQGYTCAFLELAKGETRSNITVIDASTGVTTKLNEPGPTVTADALEAFERRLVGRVVAGDLCILSGSLPPGAPEDTYARLARALPIRGVEVVLDSSGPALAAGCGARPALLQPNAVEAAELLGSLPEEDEALPGVLRRLRDLGPQRVLLSLDRRGAAYCDGAVWIGHAPAIREVSGVGAGDALLAGALWARLQGLPADQVLRWGVAAGTAAAMGQGSAMPTLDRVRDVYALVRVVPLAATARVS